MYRPRGKCRAATQQEQHYPGRCPTSSGGEQALYPIDTLNLADVIHQSIQAHKILDIQTYRTLEDAIVRMDVFSSLIYALVGCDNSRQIQEHSRAVDTTKLHRGEIRHSLLLRPLNLLLDEVGARLRSQTNKLVACRLMHHDDSRLWVAVANDTIARDGLATLRQDKL